MNITLKTSNNLQIRTGFFLIKKGQVFIRNIFENGKILGHNFIFKEGDIIGNYLQLIPAKNNNFDLDFALEVVAIEDCEFEKIQLPTLNSNSNNIYERIIFQLVKKQFLDILYILLPKQLYIMVTLDFMSNQGVITKKKINPENFNMSKSQFYNLFSKIKKDKIFTEKKEQLIVNQEKISTQLKDFFLGECK